MDSESCKCGAHLSPNDNFCPKCGATRDPQNLSKQAKPRRKLGKKIVVSIILAIISFIILVGISGMSTQGTPQESQSSITPKIFDKPVSELLPTRNDIGTEWEIGYVINDTTKFSFYKGAQTTGFTGGIQQSFRKIESFSVTTLSFIAYKYDTANAATGNYNDVVSYYRHAGGYTEIASSGINAQCYGMHSTDGFWEYGRFICVKSNVVFSIAQAGMSVDTSTLAPIANAVANKIV